MIEVERRARVEDLEAVKESLGKMNAEFLGKKKQIDRVFGHDKFLDENTKIVEGGLSARIRKVDDKDPRLDFKEIIREGSGGLEVSIHLNNVEEGKKFLDKLGFDEAFTVSKSRELYRYDGFEVCLDEVKKLGKFVEVEKEISEEKRKDEVFKKCEEILKDIASDPEFMDKKYGDLMQERINKGKD